MTHDLLTITNQLEERAALYSLGMLSQTEARAFDREIAGGDAAAAATQRGFDRLTAELALGAPEAAPTPGLRARLLERIGGETPSNPSNLEAGSHRKQALPSPASQFLHIRADEGDWRQIGQGAQIKTLFVDRARDTVTSLVRLAPGGRLPRHRHHGAEESIVLEGDCRVNGHVLLPGDYRRAPDGTVDSEITTEHGTLFLMVASREIEVLEPGWSC